MKRNFAILTILSFIFFLTACGMTTEEIDTALMQLNTTYQSGTYDQALTEVKKLDKSSKKMSDEQKSKFDELKSSLEYAISSVQGITDGFNSVQSFYDQKMYYEAQQELDKISQTYRLPPTEQKKFDEKQTAISQAITSWKITETMQKAEASLNNGDYNSASNTLSEIDASSLSEEQKQKINSLNEKIASAKAEAERKKAEAERKKKESSTISYDKALDLVKKYYQTYTSYNPPYYEKYDETSSRWIIRAYEVVSYPGETHSSTFNIIGVDKKTGALYDEILMDTIIDDNGKYVANSY